MKGYFKILLSITAAFYLSWIAFSINKISLTKDTALLVFILCYFLTMITGLSGYWKGFDYVKYVRKTEVVDEKTRKYWTYAMIFLGVWYTGMMLVIGVFVFD